MTDDIEAEKALADFEAEWGQKYPSIAPSWRCRDAAIFDHDFCTLP